MHAGNSCGEAVDPAACPDSSWFKIFGRGGCGLRSAAAVHQLHRRPSELEHQPGSPDSLCRFCCGAFCGDPTGSFQPGKFFIPMVLYTGRACRAVSIPFLLAGNCHKGRICYRKLEYARAGFSHGESVVIGTADCSLVHNRRIFRSDRHSFADFAGTEKKKTH